MGTNKMLLIVVCCAAVAGGGSERKQPGKCERCELGFGFLDPLALALSELGC